jgi:FkbM family methyltransferase
MRVAVTPAGRRFVARTGGAEPVALPNGLTAHGATRSTVRLYQLVLDYFEAGIAIEPGMTVLDVGANIGLFSLEVLQRGAGQVRLHAFEPAVEPFTHLERNVREHFGDAPARVHRCALGERPGTATLYYRPLASGLSSLDRDGVTDERRLAEAMLRRDVPMAYQDALPAWFRRIPPPIAKEALAYGMRRAQRKVVPTPCQVKTLSQVLREESLEAVDILKIDVEGAELGVLRGIGERDWPKIRTLAVEVHDIDDRVKHVRRMFEARGFRRIGVTQEWIFESTGVYMVVADRA